MFFVSLNPISKHLLLSLFELHMHLLDIFLLPFFGLPDFLQVLLPLFLMFFLLHLESLFQSSTILQIFLSNNSVFVLSLVPFCLSRSQDVFLGCVRRDIPSKKSLIAWATGVLMPVSCCSRVCLKILSNFFMVLSNNFNQWDNIHRANQQSISERFTFFSAIPPSSSFLVRWGSSAAGTFIPCQR